MDEAAKLRDKNYRKKSKPKSDIKQHLVEVVTIILYTQLKCEPSPRN